MQENLYLEDLEIGQRFESETVTVSADEIKDFATKFDPQPFHLDDRAAKSSMFGGLAASGWHTAALTMRLLVGSRVSIAGGLVGAGVEITWTRPTRPGDTLRVVSEVTEIRPSRSKPDRGMITLRSETRNQDDECVQVLVSRLTVPRRSDPAGH